MQAIRYDAMTVQLLSGDTHGVEPTVLITCAKSMFSSDSFLEHMKKFLS